LTGFDIKKRHGEECGGKEKHGQILHGKSPGWDRNWQMHMVFEALLSSRSILDRRRFEYRKYFLKKA
jgi:hypothetical protein